MAVTLDREAVVDGDRRIDREKSYILSPCFSYKQNYKHEVAYIGFRFRRVVDGHDRCERGKIGSKSQRETKSTIVQVVRFFPPLTSDMSFVGMNNIMPPKCQQDETKPQSKKNSSACRFFRINVLSHPREKNAASF